MSMVMDSVNSLTESSASSLQSLLSGLIDSKNYLGYQYASWCMRGPSIEACIALSGMAQEELGHSQVLGGLLSDGADRSATNAIKEQLITWTEWSKIAEIESVDVDLHGSWPVILVTCLAHEATTMGTLMALKSSNQSRLSQRAVKMVQEERFHLMFCLETVRTFNALSVEQRRLLHRTFEGTLSACDTRGNPSGLLENLIADHVVESTALDIRVSFLDDTRRRFKEALTV